MDQGDKERGEIMADMRVLISRFDSHEANMKEQMERGRQTMEHLNESVTTVTTQFGSFVAWFKWSVIAGAAIVGVIVGLLGLEWKEGANVRGQIDDTSHPTAVVARPREPAPE